MVWQRTAAPTDWKTELLPAKRTTVELDRTFDAAEIEVIRRGLVPEVMEDKWFIYWKDDALFFHRSWTGYCVYVVRFASAGNSHRMFEAEVNRDPEQYSETNDENDAKMISFLIDVLLLHQDSEFPTDEKSPEAKALMIWSQIGAAMFKTHTTDVAIPSEVAERLGYYVYLYVDPRTGRIFYVGKGKGKRVFSHLSVQGESEKAKILSELNAVGMKPRLEILAHALPTEETALRIEAAVIDLLTDPMLKTVSGVLATPASRSAWP